MKRIPILLALLVAVLSVQADRRALMMSKRTTAPAYSPTDTANLFAWYKADALLTNLIGTAVIADGTNIIAWGDSSGNNRTLTTNNATASPQRYKGTSSTGKAQGGIERIAGYLRVGFTAQANTTIFIVWRTATSGANSIPLDSTNSASRQIVYKSSSDFPTISATTAQSGNIAFANPSWNIVCGVFNGSGNDSLYTNGVAYSTSLTAGNESLDGLTLLTTFGDAGVLATGEYIGEVIIYARNLNSTEIGQVNTYLNGRWSVY